VRDTQDERSTWTAWWLIDPLDGTKEFVKRNGEFTVNIALMTRSKPNAPGNPIAGWVYAPVLDRLYEGISGHGAVRIDQNLKDGRSDVKKLPMEKPANPPRIVASRSHRTPETDAVIDAVSAEFGQGEIVSSGSSLKLCQIAEGSAEFYPRCAPTMEWDTAAADAVCRAAGARVVQALNGADLEYGKNNLLNPWFIVGRGDALISCAVEAIRSTQDSSEA
jgi:3'(2'), 5'-bisphosphate nucleotidase